MQKMPEITLPVDRALLHGTAAALLQAEGRYDEAEPEYLTTICGMGGVGEW